VEELDNAERRLLAALQSGDLPGAAEMVRDDFLITTAGWLREPADKPTWLAALAGEMTLDGFTLRVLASRRFGDVATALVESEQTGTHGGAPFSMTFRYTDTWVLDDGGWRLAIRHASVLPPAPAS
jgi:ketosteroid isomerase-like protein